MNALFWDCRGLGLTSWFQHFRHLLDFKKPDLVFLCETLSNNNKSDFLFKSFVDWNVFVVPYVGHSGELWSIWKKSLNVKILYFDDWVIHASLLNYNGLHV